MNSTGTLYIVATPLGNLQDISLRALELLKNAEYIACEDTRRAGSLLKAITEFVEPSEELNTPKPMLISYYEQNEFQRIPNILNLLINGKDVVLISDAGTPTISDPGFRLVRECIVQNIPVVSVPGPSAPITALAASGLPTDKFLFLGYPPHKPGHRKALFENIKKVSELISQTVILFEAPHKLIKTLEELQEVLGDIDIVVERELTKIHEEIRREKISQSIEHFKKQAPKGEFVILFHLD